MADPVDPAERRRKRWRVAFSIAAAAVLLALLFRNVDWTRAWEVLRGLSPATWLAVLVVHAGIYALRTLRFAVLIPDRRVPFTRLWSIQAANQMASLLLPLRTGEVTYPIYLRSAGVPLEVGVAGLVVSRALDLLAVLTLATASALAIGTPFEALPPGARIPAALVVAGAVAALLGLAAGGGTFVRLLARLAGRLGAGPRILGSAETAARGFETVGRRRALAEAFVLTLLVWIGVDLFYYLLMADLGFGSLGPVGVAFGASAAILTNLLPVNTFAGLGTHEWGWAAGFRLLGVDLTAAAATALAVHAVQLVNVAIFGVVAQFRLAAPPREEAERVRRWLGARRPRLLEAVRGIDPESAVARPAPAKWSIAEIVEHLALAEASIAAKMRECLAAPGDVAAGRRRRVPIAAVAWRLPGLRFEAPPRVRPASGVSFAEALAHLDRSRAELLECLASADDLALRGKRFGHFLLGGLDLLQWGRFVGYHEARHLAQIEAAARVVKRARAAC